VLGRIKDALSRAAAKPAVLRILDPTSARRLQATPERETRGRKEDDEMMRIYETVLQVVAGLRQVVPMIERHDKDLARQLRRASSSVALNVSEGSGSSGGTRRERYRNALGSARETGACLDVAMALGYVDRVDPKLLDALDKVRATLVKVAV
jgi:four helix bundle protein